MRRQIIKGDDALQTGRERIWESAVEMGGERVKDMRGGRVGVRRRKRRGKNRIGERGR